MASGGADPGRNLDDLVLCAYKIFDLMSRPAASGAGAAQGNAQPSGDVVSRVRALRSEMERHAQDVRAALEAGRAVQSAGGTVDARGSGESAELVEKRDQLRQEVQAVDRELLDLIDKGKELHTIARLGAGVAQSDAKRAPGAAPMQIV